MDTKNLDDSILADCSDEEDLKETGIMLENIWVPKPEDIETIFAQIKEKKYPELVWKCPGRRDPMKQENPESEPEVPQSTPKDNETDDFDFEDETPPSMLKLPNKSVGSSKQTGTKKRTTTLAGILSNMERHRNIERMDNNEKPSTQNK